MGGDGINRGDVHYPPASASGDHHPGGGAHQPETPGQVHLQGFLPHFGGRLLQGLPQRHRRVVDQAVQPAVVVADLVNRGLRRLPVPDVDPPHRRPPGSRGCVFDCFFVPADHRRPALGQILGDGRPDAAGGPRYYHRLSVQPLHCLPPGFLPSDVGTTLPFGGRGHPLILV